MTVPTPRTRVAGAFETATLNNQDPRDVENFLLAPPRVYAYRSAALTLTSGVETLINLDAELYDLYSPAAHDTGTNPSRLIFAEAGIYTVTAALRYGGGAGTERGLFIRKNAAGSPSGGTEVIRRTIASAGSGTTTQVGVTLDISGNANDYIELFGVADATLAMSVANAGACFMQHRWVAKQ
jgi:hypothetical protein